MNKIWKVSLVYSLASGLTRGAVIIYVVIITKYLSLEDFGTFNLAQLLIQLLAPFLSLNSAAAVLREGLEDGNKGFYLYNYFLRIAFLISCLAIPLFFVFHNSPIYWIYLSAAIAIWEGHFNCNFSVLRYLEKNSYYLLLAVFKILTVTIAFLLLAMQQKAIETLLEYQLLLTISLNILIYSVLRVRGGFDQVLASAINIRHVFKYTLPLIPHSIGQWIMNSSNRFLLKALQGLQQVGLFSVGVNVSMILNLFNSGLSMVLPVLFVKNYDEWKRPQKLNRFFVVYSLIVFVLIQFIVLGYYIDMHFIGIMKYYSKTIVWVILLNCIGYYYLGLYFIYTNFLFYLKKTNSIALSTAICAFINIVLTWILLKKHSFVSAALSSMISYYLYFLLIKFFAEKKEPSIKPASGLTIFISIVTTILLLASSMLWLRFF